MITAKQAHHLTPLIEIFYDPTLEIFWMSEPMSGSAFNCKSLRLSLLANGARTTIYLLSQ